MRVNHLWLADFRNYAEAELAPAPDGLTVVVGSNGEGKTNLLEAVGYLASLSSFRSAPTEALIRTGCSRAIVRAEGEREGRPVLVEVELHPTGRDRAQVNRQPLRRTRDLLGALRVSVFSPDDLVLVKGPAAVRRRFVDDALVALAPRHDGIRTEVDRVLRQRNTLLRQSGGRLRGDDVSTLDVWDAKLAETGEQLVVAREELLQRLVPEAAAAYDALAKEPSAVKGAYRRSWGGDLLGALLASRDDDVRRGMTLVGPHRDDIELAVGGLSARTHASQGEQRSLALALRLAVHQVVGDAVGEPPVLLLDDVFSELDPERSAALIARLPVGQALLTTAGPLPATARPARVVRIRSGAIVEAA